MIINGQRYEAEPAVEAYVKDLQAENEEQRREILRLTNEINELDVAYYNAAMAITRLRTENAQLEEGYQKSLGVIAVDSLPTKVELYKLKMMCLNHTVCETCEYIGSFGGCGLKGLPEDWEFGGADNAK